MSTAYPNLGKYQVLEEIGRGGMGAVYRGYDPFLGRAVAIKLLAPHLVWERAFLERFMREARTAARLQHPNIVDIYDVGQDGSNYYFVMAYLSGPSLKQVISQRGPMTRAQVLAILQQIADALDYAHSKGLVHRDVKPANVMFDERGQAMLTDFGIAKAAEESRLTSTGGSIGTPQYMAPEQVQGAEIDGRTDQYALSIMAFEMLTGQVPFDADSTTAILYKQVNESPPSARAFCPDLPGSVEVALNRALAKSPAARFSSCQEFVTALRQALAQPVAQPQLVPSPPTPDRGLPGVKEPAEAGPGPAPAARPRPTQPARSHPRKGLPVWVWLLMALAVLACGGGAAALLWAGGWLTAEPTTAPVPMTSAPATVSAVVPTSSEASSPAPITETAVPTAEPMVTPQPVAASALLLYIYDTDLGLAKEYADLLIRNGFAVTLVSMDQVAATDLAPYSLLIIGPDTIGPQAAGGKTGSWGDENSFSAVAGSGKPVLGIEQGGLEFFGTLDLAIGGGNAWFGTETGAAVVDPNHVVFQQPNRLTAPSLSLYTAVDSQCGVYLPDPPADVVLLGRELGDKDHYSIVLQGERYLLWGFWAPAGNLTQEGSALFLNVVHFLVSRP